MSVKAMARVFDAQGLTPTEKLVLLALADHASEDGLNIYPSVDTIHKKTALTDRTVRRIIATLRSETRGILFLVKRRGRLQNEYGMNLKMLQDLTQDQVSETRPDTGSAQDLTHDPPRPDTGSGKSSGEPSGEPSGRIGADKPRSPRPRDMYFENLADVCHMTPPDRAWKLLTQTASGQLNRYAKELRDAGAEPEQIVTFGSWWSQNDWRGQKGQPPKPADVVKAWPLYLNGNGNGKRLAPRAMTSAEVEAEFRRKNPRLFHEPK